MPNEECFADKFECQVLELLNKCKYTPPHFILKEWTNIKKDVYREMCEKLKYEYGTIDGNTDDNEEENKIILNESNNLPQNNIEMV